MALFRWMFCAAAIPFLLQEIAAPIRILSCQELHHHLVSIGSRNIGSANFEDGRA